MKPDGDFSQPDSATVVGRDAPVNDLQAFQENIWYNRPLIDGQAAERGDRFHPGGNVTTSDTAADTTADTTADAAPTNRGGRQGRAARMAGRTSGVRTAPAYLTRQIPTYELLSEEGLDLVEQYSDRILSEIGIEIRDDEEALQLFRDAGATVNGVLVRFDPGHAKALCATAPAE